MRTATLVANLLTLVILATTGIYLQSVYAELLSATGRLGFGLPGIFGLLIYLFMWMKSGPTMMPFRARLPGSAAVSKR